MLLVILRRYLRDVPDLTQEQLRQEDFDFINNPDEYPLTTSFVATLPIGDEQA
ncbi:MAG: hypothetical protein AAGF11_30900 [Myxococcota bacterium]